MKIGDKMKVLGFDCGARAYHKFNVMGIRIGSILVLEAVQPHGPYTFRMKGMKLTIGRGLLEKLEYEVI